ncbi:hypothetical protein PhCBS80983_g00189 [Powellomyces hirtus]|uniref:ZPR1 jelly-roll domain-containing protein n=1 Tax=Powellomyces hirtus TaxID=109895 RepID=A0A507EHE1_9FUNG|nr:hypothetical protein PhCBS80983_g00189 [Powellomyces hirtus]
MDISAGPTPDARVPSPQAPQEHEEPSSKPAAYKLDMGHQEMERLMEELENMYRSAPTTNADHWLPAANIALLLCSELGYEDMDEFEAALNGTFGQFLDAIPGVETRRGADGTVVAFRFLPPVAPSEWVAKRWTVRITDRAQLWWVLLKSPHARIEIPALEFEICADGARRIDSLYNHVAAAIWNLAQHHASGAAADLPAEQRDKMADCIAALQRLLDVDAPWTLVVHDPSGTSDFANVDNVEVERGVSITFD